MRGFLSALAALSLLLAPAWRDARAVDPVTVQVEGVVPDDPERPGAVRDAAFRAALTAAVLEVARDALPPAVLEASGDEIRAALEERAASFVLTFRPGSLESRPSADGPGAVEWVLPLEASVDRRAVGDFLRGRGWGGASGAMPSVALCVVPAAGLESDAATEVLPELARYVSDALGARELVLLEPALRRGGPTCRRGAVEVAQALGADVAVDVAVGWRPQTTSSGLRGGIADVRVRASRSVDGASLALSRFQGAGYHASAARALERALEAVRDQLVDNVVLQLSRNWAEVARAQGSIEVHLIDVDSLLQVEAVRERIVARLGASQAQLVELGPGEASLAVAARLSPGALGDRLSALAFEGFALDPVGVEPGRVSMRVRRAELELDEP